MSNFFNKVNLNFGPKYLSDYPELQNKKDHNTNLSYRIAIATSAVFYDVPTTGESINWKVI
jgi:hypothetical protein